MLEELIYMLQTGKKQAISQIAAIGRRYKSLRYLIVLFLAVYIFIYNFTLHFCLFLRLKERMAKAIAVATCFCMLITSVNITALAFSDVGEPGVESEQPAESDASGDGSGLAEQPDNSGGAAGGVAVGSDGAPTDPGNTTEDISNDDATDDTLTDEELVEEETLKEEDPNNLPFNQFLEIDDAIITVTADPGVFPEGAFLSARKVNPEEADSISVIVGRVRPQEHNVAKSYSYDIHVLDKNNQELQPNTAKGSVKVTFKMEEVADEDLEPVIYKVVYTEEDGYDAEEVPILPDEGEDDEIVIEPDEFSLYYSVDFCQKEEPSDEEEGEEEELTPAFEQSVTIDGVIITVTADEGVFPEDATVSARKASVKEEKTIATALNEVREEDKNVALSFTYDITILDKDEKEIQPDTEKGSVKVSFKMAQIANVNLETDIYHIEKSEEGLNATGLDVKTDTNTKNEAVVETTGFSFYTVEFTYGGLQYVLAGDEKVALSTILETVGIVENGAITAVESSNETLFAPVNENDTWYIQALQAFESEEWLKVTIDEIEYEILVTDENMLPEGYESIEYVALDHRQYQNIKLPYYIPTANTSYEWEITVSDIEKEPGHAGSFMGIYDFNGQRSGYFFSHETTTTDTFQVCVGNDKRGTAFSLFRKGKDTIHASYTSTGSGGTYSVYDTAGYVASESRPNTGNWSGKYAYGTTGQWVKDAGNQNDSDKCQFNMTSCATYPTIRAASEYLSMKIYGVKIWDDSTGAKGLKVDLVPARRTEDGAVGLYDFVKGIFVGYETSPEFKTVTFDDQDATTPGTTSINVVKGMPYTTITPPTKDSYVFDGYYDQQNGGGAQYFNSSGAPTKDNWDKDEANTVLYAKWTGVDKWTALKNALAGTNITTIPGIYEINDNSIKLLTDFINGTGGSGTITVSGTKTLDLNGHVISGNGMENIISVPNDANLTITDSNANAEHKGTLSAELENYFWTWDGGDNTGATTIKGGIITGGIGDNSENAGAIKVNGVLNMNAGTIAGCGVPDMDTVSRASAVCVNGTGASFNMNGGTIEYCHSHNKSGLSTEAENRGGAVYLYNASFKMTGGTIRNCSATCKKDGAIINGQGGAVIGHGSKNDFSFPKVTIDGVNALIENCKGGQGAGIELISGTLEFKNGTIQKCHSTGDGGGIGLGNPARINISGGKIINNRADNASGAIRIKNGTLNMTGGTISGNTAGNLAGGINCAEGSEPTINIGGSAIITGNKVGSEGSFEESNVYLGSGRTINIHATAPTEDMNVGVSTVTAPTESTPVPIVAANNTDYSKYFTSDNTAYEVKYDSDNIIKLFLRPETDSIVLKDYDDATKTFPEAIGTGTDKYSQIVIMITSQNGGTITLPSDENGYTAATAISTEYSKIVNLSIAKTPSEIAEEYIRNVQFERPNGERMKVSVSLSKEQTQYKTFYYENNDHYYQFVPFSTRGEKTWIQSYGEAKAKGYQGRQGYLSTITSLGEDLFIYKASEHAVGWVGGTTLDPGNMNGNYYDTFSTSGTNNWYWACGPEIGREFYDTYTNYYRSSDGGYDKTLKEIMDRNYKKAYHNWAIEGTGQTTTSQANGEPNAKEGNAENCLTTLPMGCGYATTGVLNDKNTAYSGGGDNRYGLYSWNDVPYNVNIDHYSPLGYMVEYGDQEHGDSNTVNPSEYLSDFAEIDGTDPSEPDGPQSTEITVHFNNGLYDGFAPYWNVDNTPADTTLTKGSTLTLPTDTNFKNIGYTLAGWTTTAPTAGSTPSATYSGDTMSGEQVNALYEQAKSSSEVTLYAVWARDNANTVWNATQNKLYGNNGLRSAIEDSSTINDYDVIYILQDHQLRDNNAMYQITKNNIVIDGGVYKYNEQDGSKVPGGSDETKASHGDHSRYTVKFSGDYGGHTFEYRRATNATFQNLVFTKGSPYPNSNGFFWLNGENDVGDNETLAMKNVEIYSLGSATNQSETALIGAGRKTANLILEDCYFHDNTSSGGVFVAGRTTTKTAGQGDGDTIVTLKGNTIIKDNKVDGKEMNVKIVPPHNTPNGVHLHIDDSFKGSIGVYLPTAQTLIGALCSDRDRAISLINNKHVTSDQNYALSPLALESGKAPQVGNYNGAIRIAQPATLTFDTNGSTKGSLPQKAMVDGTETNITNNALNIYLGAQVILPNAGTLEKDDLSFIGWNTNANGSGTDYSAGDSFTMNAESATLFAKWLNVVASITTEAGTTYFESVQEAFNTATNGQTVKLLKSVTENGVNLTGKDITFDINGKVLNASTGSVITVNTGATLTLTDTNPDAAHKGTINSNGLWVWDKGANTGKTTIKGGIITGGTGTSINDRVCGGGVLVNGGTFKMQGATIAGNTANSGGGVFVNASESGNGFTMTGGTIRNNTANEGGGVAHEMTFAMTGGAITDNSASQNGGGVMTGGFLALGGSAKITENTKGKTDNNVYLPDGRYATISSFESSAPTSEMKIGVTAEQTPTANNGVKIVAGANSTNYKYFVSDKTDETIVYCDGSADIDKDGNTFSDCHISHDANTVWLAKHTHTWKTFMKNGKLVSYCTQPGCEHYAANEEEAKDNDGVLVPLTIIGLDQVRNGDRVGLGLGTAAEREIWNALGIPTPTIMYRGRGTTNYSESATPPTEPGKYTAVIMINGDIVDLVDFEINKPASPSVIPQASQSGSSPAPVNYEVKSPKTGE